MFIYIKFYINKNNEIKPLVIDKSGSWLVNSSGSDLSFDLDKNSGPARRFLIEENLDWCKSQIAIIKCDSEQKVLDPKRFVAINFNLFEN